MKTCFLAAAVCLIPGLVWAVPPREAAKRSAANPMARPMQRPQPSGGTPSLSPTARPAKPQQAAANWKPSNLPGAANPTPSILPSPAPRPSAGNRLGQGGAGRPPMPSTQPANSIVRSPTRPAHDLSQYEPRPHLPYNQPDVVINRPDININRPTINRPNFNNNLINNNVINNNVVNNTVINQNNIVNQNIVNQQVNNCRPYYPQLHYHWQPSSWSGAYRPAYYNYSYSSTSGGW